MKILKRSGAEAVFDVNKIINAITKANQTVDFNSALTSEQIREIADFIEGIAAARDRALTVEEIQDIVETRIMKAGAFEVAKKYITYRYVRSLVRRSNSTDERILTLIECNNEDIKQENSNKNPTINSVQRDYMAGEVSKDIASRILLPQDIVEAHNSGIIHFHDMDYFAQHMHNCDLVNLEDMLQNGTVISGTMIDRPRSFSTACNIATQIIAQVASNQYGGQSITLTHLAPFVEVSRERIRKELEEEFAETGAKVSEKHLSKILEQRVREEVARGVQTIQYQVVTLMTTNGQAPFVTVFMYLGEARNEREKADLAIIIEEVLKQRYQGVKNEAGTYITPAFPKLIYVLEEDNINPDSPYYYLTELAAKCTAKRLVPDYISEKIMLRNKIDKNGEGHCYTCMGCRSFLTPYVEILRTLQPGGGHRQPARHRAFGERRHGRFLADFRRTHGSLPPRAPMPPRTTQRNAFRRRAYPLATRRAFAPEKGREDRQVPARRLLDALARLRGALGMRLQPHQEKAYRPRRRSPRLGNHAQAQRVH